MKRYCLFFFLIVLCCITTACQKEGQINGNVLKGSSPVRLINDKARFEEALHLRSESFSAPFSIDHIQRENDILKLKVSYPKGCQGHFEVLWDGMLMESYPMQARIFLQFNASPCPRKNTSGERESEMITIDLIRLIGNETTVKATVFHVSNASSLQEVSCEKDCNKPVSAEG